MLLSFSDSVTTCVDPDLRRSWTAISQPRETALLLKQASEYGFVNRMRKSVRPARAGGSTAFGAGRYTHSAPDGFEHPVEVSAETLYEVAARAGR